MRSPRSTLETEGVTHGFEWGAGTYSVEIHLPRDLRQFSRIEDALREGYVPYQVRTWPIGMSRWEAKGVDSVRNTCTGYSAVLEIDELDVPDRADAYVPSGIDWATFDVSRQMIINFLYFTKKK